MVTQAVWGDGREPLLSGRDRNLLIGQLVTDLVTPQTSIIKPQTFISQAEYQE